MRGMFHRAAALAFCLGFAAAPSSAQFKLGNWYLGVGVAYGSYNLSGATTVSSFKSNISYFGEVGIRFAPSLALGFEGDYYAKSNQGSSVNAWFYNAALTFWPDARNFWIKALAGYANTSLNQGRGSQGGYDMGLGIGYDWHIGNGGFTVVPFIQYVAQLAAAKFPSTTTDVKSTLFQVGAAIAFNH